MEKFSIKSSAILYPRNAGQQIQADLRVMFGQSPKADNKKGGADIVINGKAYQIKSPRATVCHGWDVENIQTEYANADGFIYAETETRTAYVMTANEFIAFAREFREETRESTGKNGGGKKLRLNRQFKQQREWLERA